MTVYHHSTLVSCYEVLSSYPLSYSASILKQIHKQVLDIFDWAGFEPKAWRQRSLGKNGIKIKLQTEVIYLINFHVDPEVIFEPAYGLVSSQVKLLSSSLGP